MGPPVVIDDLLYKPDSSLVRQSYEPQLLEMLNLGGFGMVSWDESSPNPKTPLKYRTTDLPIFDQNLKALAEKMRSNCLLAHIRGIAYRADSGFGPHNLHPFYYPHQRWAMAHNGDLAGFNEMRHDLLDHVTPSLRCNIQGTTDSEVVYALVLSELERNGENKPSDLVTAITHTISTLREVRAAHGIEINSAMNLLFSDGTSTVGLRFTFDYGCFPTDNPTQILQGNFNYLSLWYTMGERYECLDGVWQMTGDPQSTNAVAVASEPLTREVTGWVELPEYSIFMVDRESGQIQTINLEC